MERRPEFQKKAYELLQEQLKQIINLLPDFDKEVISMRFGLEDDYSHTLEEVCSYFNIKRDTIRLIESNVLKLIKERTENLSKNPKLSSFQENILSIINSLPSNERLIVKTKYNLENGLSLSDDEILKKYSISHEQLNKIIDKVNRRINHKPDELIKMLNC